MHYFLTLVWYIFLPLVLKFRSAFEFHSKKKETTYLLSHTWIYSIMTWKSLKVRRHSRLFREKRENPKFLTHFNFRPRLVLIQTVSSLFRSVRSVHSKANRFVFKHSYDSSAILFVAVRYVLLWYVVRGTCVPLLVNSSSSIQTVKWRMTDEDRRSKYIYRFREIIRFYLVTFKNNYFTFLLN